MAIALFFALTVTGTSEAQRGVRGRNAPSIWDREVERLRETVARQADAAAIVPLAELSLLWELAPTRTLAMVRAIVDDRRIHPEVRSYARAIEIRLRRRAGDLDGSRERIDALGFVRRWRVLGPFDNEGKHGFEQLFPPEQALDRPTDTEAEMPGAERPVRWRDVPDLGPTAVVLFDAFFSPPNNVCGYAETFVRLDRARAVDVLVGATGALRVYWNGAKVIEDPLYRVVDVDRAGARVAGRAGWNRILVKVCGGDAGQAFLLRVTEPDGAPIRLVADPRGASLPAPATIGEAAPSGVPVTVLGELEAAVAAHPEQAAPHEALARYLHLTSGEDPSQHRVLDLAMRAVELGATPRNLLFAASLQPSRAERARLVERARRLATNDPEVELAYAELVRSGAGGERALHLLEAIPPDSPTGLVALATRAAMLESLGLPQSARGIHESLVARVPEAVRYKRALASSEARLGHADRATDLYRQVLAVATDDSDTRRALASDAVARSDRERAFGYVRDEIAHWPLSSTVRYWAASVYDALGAEEEELTELAVPIELDPSDAEARVQLGRALLRSGRRDPALAALRVALALRPQDAATRLLVEQIEPEARPDEAYATPIETILRRRRRDGEWPASVLHTLEVHTVHENGLSSSYHQIVTQIHDAEGARERRSHGIRYEPSTQWVDVRSVRVHRGDQVLTSYEVGERSLAEPAYRIYYSARELVVTLPVLEPGDVVELRYRVEDIAQRNEYAGYFGALRGLQQDVPVIRSEQVFLTPSSRHIHFNQPAISVAHEQRLEGPTRIDRFGVDDAPALRTEPYMPGYFEVAPYLHVSSYGTWDEVARFWWGLAEDQLEPDASLVATVRELVANAPDTRTKVERIHAWATDRVRYVGLEFGIHGHKPYRVADVVRRGFGDCKDTAGVLYAMLRIAGIEARVALVRTGSWGTIADAPPSLEVFNHAVAYVPELDLFLDGTSERSGIDELPLMDRGGIALVVGPASSELRTIPQPAPSATGRTRDLRIELAVDGSATLRSSELVEGSDAASARSTYGAPGTRRERLTRSLSGLFPGIELTDERFESLDDRERPVRYGWTARVPVVGERDGAVVRIGPSVLESLTRAWAPTPTRRHDLVLGTPRHYVERRVIAHAGLTPSEVPRGGVAESPFGRVVVRYTSTSTEVVAETELVLSRDRVRPDEYPAFRQWVEAADALVDGRIAFGGLR